MAVYLPLDLIVSDPHVRSGRPVLAGTGVRVQDIAAAYVYRQQSVQEVAENYTLKLGRFTLLSLITTNIKRNLKLNSPKTKRRPNAFAMNWLPKASC